MNIYHVKSPSSIITSQLGIPLQYKQECIEECYRIGDKQNQQTNVKGIMSSYHVWEETDKFSLVFDNIIRFLDTYCIKDRRYKPVLRNAWSAIYKKGHYTQPHNHSPFNLSWVYYLKANMDSPLIFNECDFRIKPIDDMLVVFESNLIHSVDRHMGEEDRVCLAGNALLGMINETNFTSTYNIAKI